MFTPAMPRDNQTLYGNYASANKSIVWLPDSVVAEWDEVSPPEIDRIRPYFRYGNVYHPLEFKSVSYPAVDPESQNHPMSPSWPGDSRLSEDSQKLWY